MMHAFGGPPVHEWGITEHFNKPRAFHFRALCVVPTEFRPPARRYCHLWSPERRARARADTSGIRDVRRTVCPPRSPSDSMRMDRVLLEPVGDWGPRQSPPWAPDRSRSKGKRLDMIHGCDRRLVIFHWELQSAVKMLEFYMSLIGIMR